MYEPSRMVASFFIAGFQHADGAMVLADLAAGTSLTMEAERDNPHDPNAMVLRYEGTKLGYLPQEKNELFSLLAFYGHGDIFEARVIQVDPQADPWKQVRVGLYVRDAR